MEYSCDFEHCPRKADWRVDTLSLPVVSTFLCFSCLAMRRGQNRYGMDLEYTEKTHRFYPITIYPCIAADCKQGGITSSFAEGKFRRYAIIYFCKDHCSDAIADDLEDQYQRGELKRKPSYTVDLPPISNILRS
jgi:hypothetical protein